MSTPLVDTSNTAHVRKLRGDDVEWASELWMERFGVASKQILQEAVDDEIEHVAGFVAMVDNSRAGFGISFVTSPEWIQNDLKIDVRPHVSKKWNGVLYQVCVETEYESRGIASMLTRKRLDYLREYEQTTVHHVVAVSWLRDDHVDSSEHLEKFGFEPAEFYDNYYPEYRECPDCGTGCTCDAELYVRDFYR